MALGFNNQPVNWQQDFSGYYDAAASMRQTGNIIAGAITEYSQKQEKKKKDEQAAVMLQDYLKQTGADPAIWSDKGKIKAGVESVGADAVLQMGEAMRQKQEQDADRQRIAEGISIYSKATQEGASHERAAMAAGDAYMQAGGKNPQAIMEYVNQLGDARYKESRQKLDERRVGLEEIATKANVEQGRRRANLEEIKLGMDVMAQPTELRYKEELARTMADNRKTNASSRALIDEERRARTARIKALTAATEAKGGDRDVTAGIMAKYEAGDDAGALADFRKAAGSDMTMDDLEAFIQEKASAAPAKDQPGANRDNDKIVAPGGFTIRVK